MPKDTALAEFAREVKRPDSEINLARAVLLMARFEYPDLDVSRYESLLDALAGQAAQAVNPASDSAVELGHFLFVTAGFSGNDEHYFDPRNSFLNEVLERRLGIPISLSLLYMEVARRVGIDARGVGLPGHFIVSVRGEAPTTEKVIFLDPYHGGKMLTVADCEKRVAELTRGSIPFNPAFLEPVSSRYILMRMLNNLKNIYANASDYQRARFIVERLLALNPDNPEEIRNLGLLYGALGQHRQAVELLEKYMQRLPDAPDFNAVKDYVLALTRNITRLN